MTTTNGTRAILASLDAERVLVAAFVNFAADVRAARCTNGRADPPRLRRDRGRISYEDTLLAGAFAGHFADLRHDPMGNDEAEIAAGLWAGSRTAIWFKGQAEDADDEPTPVRYLRRGVGGPARAWSWAARPTSPTPRRSTGPAPSWSPSCGRDPLRIVAATCVATAGSQTLEGRGPTVRMPL